MAARRAGPGVMDDSKLLSAFQELHREKQPKAAALPRHKAIFDACHVGVVLRAVLFVEAVMGVGAMFDAGSLAQWVQRFAVLSAAALPGALGWLVVTCSCKWLLARLPAPAQQGFGVGLGALCGLYGCGILALVGLPGPVPWVASAFAGALLSSSPEWERL